MLAVDKENSAHLYQQVVDFITDRIDSGTLPPGQRLPSLRRLSATVGVSVPTVRQAYTELERQGRVVSRPRSGYYVRAAHGGPLVKAKKCVSGRCRPTAVDCRSLIERVYDAIHQRGLVPLGIANPSMARPAARSLHRTMKRVMGRAEARNLSYAPLLGEPALRRQIAHRYVDLGGDVDPDDVLVTNGGQEAIMLALKAVASPGDVIAVESPTYFGAMELIESLGMLAIEIDTCSEEGIMLDSLAEALDRHPIRACLFASALNNPLGSCMPEKARERMVSMLEERDVALIEDDVYGELLFDGSRPRPAQFYSRKGLVLTCGSFSKTVAPGYRIGWLLPGRYAKQTARLKRAFSCSSGLLQQLTLSEFIATGDYDRYLNTLRPVLRCNAERARALVWQHFPEGTHASRPAGGSVLWLELPRSVSSEELFDRAIAEGISVAPGLIFSPRRRYAHCIRVSFGHPWSDEIANGLGRLGALAGELAGA